MVSSRHKIKGGCISLISRIKHVNMHGYIRFTQRLINGYLYPFIYYLFIVFIILSNIL